MIDELYRAMHTKGTPEKPQPGLAPNFEHSPEYTEMLKESNAGLPVHYPNVRKTTPKSTIERPAVSTPPIVAAPAIEKPAAPAVAEQPVPSAHTESGGEQSIAHRYLDARGNIIFMGGTLQQRYDRAYQYFKGIALPEKDTVQQLFVVGESKDPETGEPSMRPLTRDAMGSIVRDRWTGIAMLPPNLKEVTKQAD
jgi:hypothetical protein